MRTVGMGPADVVWLEWGVGAGSLIILAGVLVHRAARPLRGSVSCGSGWSVPCVSIQLTLSQTLIQLTLSQTLIVCRFN